MSSGFVTETEAAKARQRRQEEWEKVRTPDQPLERPEEQYDGRSLYDRLKEQKVKKDAEYEEAHKLKNLIRGLDDDEAQFLELVDKNRMDAEKRQMFEEEQEMKEFRNRVATLQQESVEKKIQSEIHPVKAKCTPKATSARSSQRSLLGVSIKRKHSESNGDSPADSAAAITTATATTTKATSACKQASLDSRPQLLNINTNEFDRGQLKCVAILPGIGPYAAESSDSEISSGSEDEPEIQTSKYDLLGIKRSKKSKCQEE